MFGRLLLVVVAMSLGAVACSPGESIVEPGPGEAEETTTTTEAPDDDASDGELVTTDTAADLSTTTTAAPSQDEGSDDGDANAGIVEGDGVDDVVATTVVINEASANAGAYTELAASGLVLSLDEQDCADTQIASAVDEGVDPVDAVAGAVQGCASPKAIDDFASGLIRAGGSPLPPTEAACVSSKLQVNDEYRPFWRALLDEEPFDFLLAESVVQERYLDLYAECVSVGRAVSQQVGVELSPPTQGCINALYDDREFVRVTIEADLSGDPSELARINDQIASCLSADERDALNQ